MPKRKNKGAAQSIVVDDATIGAPYYDYNIEGNPLTRNVTLPDVVITGSKGKKVYNPDNGVIAKAKRKALNAIGMSNSDIKRMQSDLVELGILPEGGGNGTNYGVVMPGILDGAPNIKITKANASKLTPNQWTAAQDAAIARGDMVEAQRLRDLHFETVSTNQVKNNDNSLKKLYRGSRHDKYKLTQQNIDNPTYATDDYEYAANFTKDYKHPRLGLYIYGKPDYNKIRTLYGSYTTSLGPVDDMINGSINSIRATNRFKGDLIYGHDFKPFEDSVKNWHYSEGTEYAFNRPQQLKLTDAVTYDDNGIRIPLGERDNFSINDIRYGLLAPIAGATGYGLYNNTRKYGGSSRRCLATGGKGTKRNIQLSDIALPLLGGVGGLLLTDAGQNLISRGIMNYARRQQTRNLLTLGYPYPRDFTKKTNVAQDTYLTSRSAQEREFLDRGYIKGKDKDYGLVKAAVGNRNIPVYQRNPDDINANRDYLVPIFNGYDTTYNKNDDLDATKLEHAGDYPYTIYVDGRSGHTNEYYKKAWDLNDYGNTNGRAGFTYRLQTLANLLDKVGSPTVVTTGFQKYNNASDKLWDFIEKQGLRMEWHNGVPVPMTNDVVITGKRKSKEKGGGIHINPANKGKFTATMKRTGKTAEELSHSSNPLTRKRAIFALNARKWNH